MTQSHLSPVPDIANLGDFEAAASGSGHLTAKGRCGPYCLFFGTKVAHRAWRRGVDCCGQLTFVFNFVARGKTCCPITPHETGAPYPTLCGKGASWSYFELKRSPPLGINQTTTAASAQEDSLFSKRSWNLKAELSFICLNASSAESAFGPNRPAGTGTSPIAGNPQASLGNDNIRICADDNLSTRSSAGVWLINQN